MNIVDTKDRGIYTDGIILSSWYIESVFLSSDSNDDDVPDMVEKSNDQEDDDDEDEEGAIATAKSLFRAVTGNISKLKISSRVILQSIGMSIISGKNKKKPKRQTICKETKLLYFQSTTPDELYLKKIDSAEYGEAIILARHYSLDCDLVYKRQWKLSNHGKASISDYLAKVIM